MACFGHPVCRGGSLFRTIQLDHARAGGISGRPRRAAVPVSATAPGFDGRPAVDVLPKPEATVTVDIGGHPAKVSYAGAASGMMPGVLQADAGIPASVQPGNSVPVHVTIGGVASQDGVTLAVN